MSGTHDPVARPSVLPSRPVQRPGVRLWNGVARALNHRTRPFDAAELMEAAARKTGLTDFGPSSFEEPLERFLEALHSTEDLHPFGVYYTRTFWLLSPLSNRLCLEAAWRPEMDEVRVSRPLIILGLPRTGTTHLVNLLSCDPDHRFLSNAEGFHPAGTAQASRPAVSRWLSALEIGLLNHLAPALKRIHEFRVEGPEECTFLMFNEFAHHVLGSMFDVPEYVEWLNSYDFRPAMRYHRRQLQLLQSKRSGERWLLKSPGHLACVEALIETYPDACFVHTHRDPAKVLPSCCSLFAMARAIPSRRADPHRVAQQMLDAWAPALEKTLEARRRHGGDRFFDVYHQDLVDDPMGVVHSIYRHFGFDLMPEAEERMQAYLARAPRHKHGVHRYSLEQFGLDEGVLDRYFGRYVEELGVTPERPSNSARQGVFGGPAGRRPLTAVRREVAASGG